MMELTNVQLLVIVNFFYYVASGLIVPRLPDHILDNGGNHFVLGLLCSSLLVCNNLARQFIIHFDMTKKQYVLFCLCSAFITNLVLVLSNNPIIIWFDRSIYALTNQVNWYCKEYVAVTYRKADTVKHYYGFLDIAKIMGLLIGIFCSGHFHNMGGFTIIATISTILVLLSMIFVQFVEPDPSIIRRQSVLVHLPDEVYEQFENLREADLAYRWITIIFLLVYTFTFTIFFSRGIFLIHAKHLDNAVAVGYSVGYQFLIRYFSEVFESTIQYQFKNIKRLFKISLVICASSLGILPFAPNMAISWMLYIPMITSYTVMNSLLRQDILNLRWDTSLLEAVTTLQTIVEIVSPVFFGILNEMLGWNAIYILYVFPITAYAYLLIHWLWIKHGHEKRALNDDNEEEKEVF